MSCKCRSAYWSGEKFSDLMSIGADGVGGSGNGKFVFGRYFYVEYI
jgi:hypothetical protein